VEPLLMQTIFVKIAITPAKIVLELMLLIVRNVIQLEQRRSSIQEPVLQTARPPPSPPLIMLAPVPLVMRTVQLAVEQRILNAFHAPVPSTISHLLEHV
jgi:hypothetical protein